MPQPREVRNGESWLDHPASVAHRLATSAASPDIGLAPVAGPSPSPGAYSFAVSSSAFSSAAEMMKLDRFRRSISAASLSFAFSAGEIRMLSRSLRVFVSSLIPLRVHP